MNIENRYQVTASLFMLKEIKRRQEHVDRGYELLKRKAEGLRIKGRQVASELIATHGLLSHKMKEAYMSLAAIKFTNGESNALVLENVEQAQIRVQRITENVSGVTTTYLEAIEETGVTNALQYAGLGAGGHRTSEAKKSFREAVHLVLKLASLRKTCVLLDEAIRIAWRKVNGIEKVIMPKLRNTEHYILVEIDECEREEFHRLKMVKAKKLKNKAMAVHKPINRQGGDHSVLDSKPLVLSYEKSSDVLMSVLHPCQSLTSSSVSFGDCKPICYPHNWDDDDLLF
ncbi:V-type proton ATPase subunit D-like [Bombyx mandarina]|uniref:V-type proton ATPase subunit D-like n=1 Tax=Bombyx mandarina TaxID=7092 RepID=A0A6J2J9S5_BOMMA|nr:V-type proton ATPase subunit D-like [Bombyx mandarina]